MTYDMILFTGIEGPDFPFKTAGSYKIASFLRQQGYSVKVIDCLIYLLGNNFDDMVDYIDEHIGKNTKFIGFGTTFLGTDTDLLDKFMERIYFNHPHVKIVLGGFGRKTPKLIQNEKVDHWVKGLSENNILKVLNEKDVPKVVYDPTHAASFNFRESVPMFSKEDNITYGEVLPIEISRGCRFKCKFCSFDLLGRKPSDDYLRSEDSMYNELKYNYEHFGTTQYQFLCDTFNETPEKLLSVKKAMERVGIDFNFWAYIRVDLLHAFPEQISILRDMGVRNVFFGIESLHDPSSKAVGKGLGREKTIKTIKKVKESWGKDSLVTGSFIVGLPHETEDTAKEWLEMIINGETYLDKATIGALRLRPAQLPGDAWRFTSVFDRNAKAYGYKTGQIVDRKNMEWVNDNFNYESALKLARLYFNKFVERYPIRDEGGNGGEGRYLSMLNCGYSWREIVDNKTKDLGERGLKLYEKYADDVFLN